MGWGHHTRWGGGGGVALAPEAALAGPWGRVLKKEVVAP